MTLTQQTGRAERDVPLWSVFPRGVAAGKRDAAARVVMIDEEAIRRGRFWRVSVGVSSVGTSRHVPQRCPAVAVPALDIATPWVVHQEGSEALEVVVPTHTDNPTNPEARIGAGPGGEL